MLPEPAIQVRFHQLPLGAVMRSPVALKYAALATRIDQQVKSIVANCRLPADADANLHFIVADLLQGVSLMRGEDTTRSRHDGAALIHGALQAYGQYFDDPAWKPDAPMQVK